MTWWSLVWKNLWRRRMRTTLTVSGLAIAVTAVTALFGVSRGFEDSFLRLYRRRGCDLVVQRSGGIQRLNSGLDDSLGDRIRSLPGVRQVIGGLMDIASFEEAGQYAVIVNGWPADSPVLDAVQVVAGRRLMAKERDCVMLGRVLADNLRKSVGDRLELYGQDCEIVGVFESFNVLENGAVFVLLPDMQRYVDRPGQVTGYVVLAEQTGDRRAVNELRLRIAELAPDLSVLPTEQFVSSISQIRLSRGVAWAISSIAVVLGTIGILNTMTMSVFERTREIGTLRALGWRGGKVVRLIMTEALLLGVLGAAVGCVCAALLLNLLGRLAVTNGLISGDLPAAVALLGALLAVGMGTAGTIYPAVWAGRLPPADALRRS